MSDSKIVVGLDIGTTKVAVIVGQSNKDGKLEVLGFSKTEAAGIHRGQIANLQEAVTTIGAALKESEIKSNVEISEVVVGIAGQHIRSTQHRGNIVRSNNQEEISKEDVEKLKDNMWKINTRPGERIVSVITQEYFIDSNPVTSNPVGMIGSELAANFHIITGNVNAVRNIYECVNRVNCDIKELILEPLASANAVLDDEEKEAGVVLVDIGGGTTDVAVIHDNIVRHTAVIPFGGNIITEDIKEGCMIIRSQAEKLKVKYGSCLSNQNRQDEIITIPGIRGHNPREISMHSLASIIQSRVQEILGQVAVEIKNSGYEDKLIAGIVLTGGGALIKHIKELTEFTTGMSVRIGFPTDYISEKSIQDLNSPIYSTSIGLALQALMIEDDVEEVENNTQADKKKRKAESKSRKLTGEGVKKIFENLFGDRGEEYK